MPCACRLLNGSIGCTAIWLAGLIALFTGSVLVADDAAKQPSKPAAFDVPEGSPQELLDFIRATKARFVEGKSRDERVDFMRRQQRAVVAAADRVLAPGAGGAAETTAIFEKLTSLWVLTQMGDREASAEAVRMSQSLKDDPRRNLADRARAWLLWKRCDKPRPGRDELAAILADIGAELERGNRDDLLVNFASGLPLVVGREEPELGAKYAREFAALLAEDSNERARRAAVSLESYARRMALVGQTMTIEGPLVSGGDFDWQRFAGKVVLVDYWATWCAPCVAEIPDVLATYRQFHERGFEVVAISLDDDRAKLAQFVADRELPWPVICGRTRESSGKNHPMVVKYGVEAIPQSFLLDRAGKVVALDVHGQKLPTLVERLLGARESAAPRD